MSSLTWKPGLLGRRRLIARSASVLAAAASSGLIAGCGHRRASTVAHPAGYPILVPGLSAAELASFAAFAPNLDPLPQPTLSARVHASSAQWEILGSFPFASPKSGAFTPLDPALRQFNVQESTLIPGAFDAFAGAGGGHYGMPIYGGPWGVRYDSAVFQQLGIAEPSPNWTIADFEDVCAIILAAKAAGHLPQLRSVLPPLVGNMTMRPRVSGSSTPGLPYFGQWNDADLWGAFVIGFGGSVVSGGRFDLTNAGAIAGLQRMADIAARYAPTPSVVAGAGPGPCALAFAPTAGFSYSGKPGGSAAPVAGPPRWARFPVLPVRAVVPFKVEGASVAQATGTPLFTGAGAPPGTPPDALLAVVQYALWWWGRERETPALIPPVLVADAIQRAYWTASARPPGSAAVGDWSHFAVVEAGWPLVPDQNPSNIAYVGEKPSPVYTALTAAVQQKVPVSRLVGQLSAQLNAMLS